MDLYQGATVLSEQEIPYMLKAMDMYGEDEKACSHEDYELLADAHFSWANAKPHITFSPDVMAAVLRALDYLRGTLPDSDPRTPRRQQAISSLRAKLADAKTFDDKVPGSWGKGDG